MGIPWVLIKRVESETAGGTQQSVLHTLQMIIDVFSSLRTIALFHISAITEEISIMDQQMDIKTSFLLPVVSQYHLQMRLSYNL